jgi:hypothetical protein
VLKSATPIVQVCEECKRDAPLASQDILVEPATIEKRPGTKLVFPPCPACGTVENFFILTPEENPKPQAQMVRELAASLGLIQRTDPIYFPQP